MALAALRPVRSLRYAQDGHLLAAVSCGDAVDFLYINMMTLLHFGGVNTALWARYNWGENTPSKKPHFQLHAPQ